MSKGKEEKGRKDKHEAMCKYGRERSNKQERIIIEKRAGVLSLLEDDRCRGCEVGQRQQIFMAGSRAAMKHNQGGGRCSEIADDFVPSLAGLRQALYMEHCMSLHHCWKRGECTSRVCRRRGEVVQERRSDWRRLLAHTKGPR